MDGDAVDRVLARAEQLAEAEPAEAAALLAEAAAWADTRNDLSRSARVDVVRAGLAVATGDLSAAMMHFRAARGAWIAHGNPLEACLAELGCTWVHVILGEYDAVREQAVRIRRRAEAVRYPDDVLLTRINAEIHFQLGNADAGLSDVTEALRRYDLAENLFHALGDHASIAKVRHNRGMVYLDLGIAHRAVGELESAYQWFTSVGSRRWVPIVAPFLAHARALTGQVATALELLEEVEPLILDDAASRALHDLGRARVLLASGLFSEAALAAHEADRVFRAFGGVELSARALRTSAEASTGMGRYDVAAEEFAVAERLFAAAGAPLKLSWVWLGQARLALETGDVERALERCRKVIEAPRDPAAAQALVQAHILAADATGGEESDEHIAAAQRLALGSGIPELRMETTLAEAHLRQRAGDHDAAISALRRNVDVARTWMQSTGQVANGPARGVAAESTDALIEALVARGDHAGRVEAWQRAHTVKVRTLRSMTAAAAPGAGLLGGLPPEDLPVVPLGTLVEYYVSGTDLLAFVLRDGHVDVRRLSGGAALSRRLVSSWQQECMLIAATGPGGRGAEPDPRSRSLDSLYEVLVAPLRDLLDHLDEEVRVIGHRHLHAVPFDALLDDGGPWRRQLGGPTGPFLAATSGSGPTPSVLVVAVPDAAAPSIRDEAETIFATLPTAEVLLGDRATRDAVREHAGEADLVHVACHGSFRAGNPLYSSLLLGDGWLSARDILREDLGLRDSVVVLSACSAGLGPADVPEPLGLTWACLAAGARAVVAALWQVDDAVTFELMTHFYRSIAAGLEPEEALRQARRAIAVTHPHPYYWAAFRLFVADEVPDVARPALGA